jgi:hypothetical protein
MLLRLAEKETKVDLLQNMREEIIGLLKYRQQEILFGRAFMADHLQIVQREYLKL